MNSLDEKVFLDLVFQGSEYAIYRNAYVLLPSLFSDQGLRTLGRQVKNTRKEEKTKTTTKASDCG